MTLNPAVRGVTAVKKEERMRSPPRQVVSARSGGAGRARRPAPRLQAARIFVCSVYLRVCPFVAPYIVPDEEPQPADKDEERNNEADDRVRRIRRHRGESRFPSVAMRSNPALQNAETAVEIPKTRSPCPSRSRARSGNRG